MLQRIQRKAIEADMHANMASKGRSLSVDDGDVAVALAQAAVTNIQHVMNQENVQQQIASGHRDHVSNNLASCAYESGCDSGSEVISRSNSNGSISGNSMSVNNSAGTSNSNTSGSSSSANNNNNNSVNVASKCAGGKEEEGGKGAMPLWQMMCSGTLGEKTTENSVMNAGVKKRR